MSVIRKRSTAADKIVDQRDELCRTLHSVQQLPEYACGRAAVICHQLQALDTGPTRACVGHSDRDLRRLEGMTEKEQFDGRDLWNGIDFGDSRCCQYPLAPALEYPLPR